MKQIDSKSAGQSGRAHDSLPRPAHRRNIALCVVSTVLTVYLIGSCFCSSLFTVLFSGQHSHRHDRIDPEYGCKQPDPLFPSPDTDLDKLFDFISSDAFRRTSIKHLSGAVQVKSESFDDLKEIGQDPRWDVMYDFYAYLQKTFPLVHTKLQVEKVNTHGLLYTWQGSIPQMKPTLLLAHQDTVPVPAATIASWTYPPWSGFYDGKYVWGRGASDCKNQLIAVLEALELLLQAKFTPRRTVLVSLGFDEECSGRQGAGHLAPLIQKRYGKESMAVIVDEGSGFEKSWGTLFAKPGTAEKGYTDVHLTVRMSGGHSSVPPDHTAIGVVSELITKIEADRYTTRLVEENPYYAQLQCGAAHSPNFPAKLKQLLDGRLSCKKLGSWLRDRHNGGKRAWTDDLALEAAKEGPHIKYLMQTSQAVDLIFGGAKVNALPERVQATVNHRINVGDTPQMVWDRLAGLAGEVGRKYNLTVHAFNGDESASSITLSRSATTLQVAPVTPAEGPVWDVLAGTTRAVYNIERKDGQEGRNVVVTPGIMTGNTDTRYYWALTKNIFRFGPGFDAEDPVGLGGGVHSVDERVSVLNHVNAVRWFVAFLRNMDAADI